MLRLGSTSWHSNAADAVHYAAAGLTSEEHISRNGNLGFVYPLPVSSSSSSSIPLSLCIGSLAGGGGQELPMDFVDVGCILRSLHGIHVAF